MPRMYYEKWAADPLSGENTHNNVACKAEGSLRIDPDVLFEVHLC